MARDSFQYNVSCMCSNHYRLVDLSLNVTLSGISESSRGAPGRCPTPHLPSVLELLSLGGKQHTMDNVCPLFHFDFTLSFPLLANVKHYHL